MRYLASAAEEYLRAREARTASPPLLAEDPLREDRVAFANKIGVQPDAWQEALLRSTSERILLNVSRQLGKSTTTAIIALHRAVYYPDSLVLCLAPALRQSQEWFDKVSDFYGRLRQVPSPESDRKLGMRLANGSRIEALPGSEKTVRGFSGTSLLILDEAARIDDALYHAVRPMLAVSGGALMMLSTPFGKRGVFYEAWTSGIGWERYEVPASRCSRITPEFLEEERESLPGWVYRQEYECSFEETEDQVFTTEMVERAVSSEVTPLFAQG